MLSSKFLLLALGSLILYSCYINYIYVGLDQDIYPVYLYDPLHTQEVVSSEIMIVDSTEELQANIEDGYAVGINAFSGTPEIVMVSSNIRSVDHYRAAYAFSLLSPANSVAAERIGADSKEMKSRREITCEFLFFELAAVGFLGLASTLFKERQMGMIRVHGVLPVSRTAFILSKLILFLLSDLIFSALLTVINLGVAEGLSVLPHVCLQAGILSLLMAAGFQTVFLVISRPGGFHHNTGFPCGTDWHYPGRNKVSSHVSSVYGNEKCVLGHIICKRRLLHDMRIDDYSVVPACASGTYP